MLLNRNARGRDGRRRRYGWCSRVDAWCAATGRPLRGALLRGLLRTLLRHLLIGIVVIVVGVGRGAAPVLRPGAVGQRGRSFWYAQ